MLDWGGLAVLSVDYTLTVTGGVLSSDGKTLTINAGTTSATITIVPKTDSVAEPVESFVATILPNAGYAVGTPSSVSGTIADAATLPTLSVSDATIVEGRTDSWAYVDVTLSAPSTQTVTVTLRTYDGTAKAGSDYKSQVTTVTFAPGQTTVRIAVRILGDKARESNETFTVELSSPTNAVLARSVGTITIVDDDGAR
jgi:hypothetical protein